MEVKRQTLGSTLEWIGPYSFWAKYIKDLFGLAFLAQYLSGSFGLDHSVVPPLSSKQ